jgi:uncharacterized membrane protein
MRVEYESIIAWRCCILSVIICNAKCEVMCFHVGLIHMCVLFTLYVYAHIHRQNNMCLYICVYTHAVFSVLALVFYARHIDLSFRIPQVIPVKLR